MIAKQHAPFKVSSGWRELVTDLISDLDAMNPDYEIAKCYARHGSLRFYALGLSPAQWRLVRRAEHESVRMCEMCGEPGQLAVVLGLTTTRCQKHYYWLFEEKLA